jgi:hypothetical protein
MLQAIACRGRPRRRPARRRPALAGHGGARATPAGSARHAGRGRARVAPRPARGDPYRGKQRSRTQCAAPGPLDRRPTSRKTSSAAVAATRGRDRPRPMTIYNTGRRSVPFSAPLTRPSRRASGHGRGHTSRIIGDRGPAAPASMACRARVALWLCLVLAGAGGAAAARVRRARRAPLKLATSGLPDPARTLSAPSNCSGWPEPRLYLEGQAWFTKCVGPGEARGRRRRRRRRAGARANHTSRRRRAPAASAPAGPRARARRLHWRSPPLLRGARAVAPASCRACARGRAAAPQAP